MEAVLAGCFLDEVPERLIGDKAYDSDALDQTLAEDYGVEMISPNRSNRKQKTQDGRPLRRYRRRWKIETDLRLDAELPPTRHAMGIPHRKLPRLCTASPPTHAAQAFMRWLFLAPQGQRLVKPRILRAENSGPGL